MQICNRGQFGLATACLVALASPVNGALACDQPPLIDPTHGRIVLLATALDAVSSRSFRASSARVEKVIEGKYEPTTVQLYRDNVRNSCISGSDVEKGASLVIYFDTFKDAEGKEHVALLNWLTPEQARRWDSHFKETSAGVTAPKP
jgi:hypothetical protein